MKRIIPSLAVGALIVGAIPQQQAIAQVAPPVTITIDENGNAASSNPGVLGAPVSQGLVPDPTFGITGPVVLYSLGDIALQGEVIITEPSASATLVVSDVIRFVQLTPGINRILFYSDNADGGDALADTGLPTQTFGTNPQTLMEVGTEGDNGAFYHPTANQPGFITGLDVTYHFISEVPEMNTIVAGFAVAGMVVFRFGWRARARHRNCGRLFSSPTLAR